MLLVPTGYVSRYSLYNLVHELICLVMDKGVAPSVDYLYPWKMREHSARFTPRKKLSNTLNGTRTLSTDCSLGFRHPFLQPLASACSFLRRNWHTLLFINATNLKLTVSAQKISLYFSQGATLKKYNQIGTRDFLPSHVATAFHNPVFFYSSLVCELH